MVPGEVIYRMLIDHPTPSVLGFARILHRTRHRAIITQKEDEALNKRFKSSVPCLASFVLQGDAAYFDHRCRYTMPGIENQLVQTPSEGWFQSHQRHRKGLGTL